MTKKENKVIKDFIAGIIFLIIIQAGFMIGGLYIENKMNVPITGIPSALGLTTILLIGIIMSKKKREYFLLGSFTFAFIAPLILYLIILFNAMPFTAPHLYYSIMYIVTLIVFVWGYFLIKIFKSSK